MVFTVPTKTSVTVQQQQLTKAVRYTAIRVPAQVKVWFVTIHWTGLIGLDYWITMT